jgi:DNA-directed RNA polymerase subunit M/transcription elongation factor TFIIS
VGRHKEIKIVTTECIFCKEMIFPEKINIGNNVYKCPECGCFLELEKEEKIIIFEPKMDLDPTIH